MIFNRFKTIFSFCAGMMLLSFTACQDMLETDSSRVVFEEDVVIHNTSEAYYAYNGILRDLQKLGDRYVIFGELRGDLMTVGENASLDMKAINEFATTPTGEYADKRDYYNLINNCNYVIQRMDTSVTIRTEKVMLPTFAAIKIVRAWAYLQLVQAYGTVSYLEQPVLSLEESLATFPSVNMDELVDKLIEDLFPYLYVVNPEYGQRFIPVPVMLGDLYLYKNDYIMAASMYYHYIYQNGIFVGNYPNYWTQSSFEVSSIKHPNSYSEEFTAVIQYNTEPQYYHSKLVSLTMNDKFSLCPSQNYLDSMAAAVYCFAPNYNMAPTAYTIGDLRGYVPATQKARSEPDAYGMYKLPEYVEPLTLISKFDKIAKIASGGSDPANKYFFNGLAYLDWIPVFRTPHLYLRYAEAVNRAGKPSFAFATLKYGLTYSNVNDPKSLVINPAEIATGEYWLQFPPNSNFNNNFPMAARGRGQGIPRDNHYFVIPDYTPYEQVMNEDGTPYVDNEGFMHWTISTDANKLEQAKQDSINWVELRILDEMAAETPFEGNRYFDLLRIARHRNEYPAFMAEKVSAKYGARAAEMKSKLMDPNAWYIK